jgi:hypothetical protein
MSFLIDDSGSRPWPSQIIATAPLEVEKNHLAKCAQKFSLACCHPHDGLGRPTSAVLHKELKARARLFHLQSDIYQSGFSEISEE